MYGDPFIRRRLKKWHIHPHQLEYQECYSAASDAYLYSIHRCALCRYSHVEFYIRKMIAVAVIWALAISHPDKDLCQTNNLTQVRLDALERRDLW